jgi:hypothetical protein
LSPERKGGFTPPQPPHKLELTFFSFWLSSWLFS